MEWTLSTTAQHLCQLQHRHLKGNPRTRAQHFTVMVFTELPQSVQFLWAISPRSWSPSYCPKAPCSSAPRPARITSDECLQDSCRGTSRWRSNGRRPPWPRRRARWRGQKEWRRRSWRTPRPGSRSHRPTPPPPVLPCCSANEGRIRDGKEARNVCYTTRLSSASLDPQLLLSELCSLDSAKRGSASLNGSYKSMT